jgi:hypothetical protein
MPRIFFIAFSLVMIGFISFGQKRKVKVKGKGNMIQTKIINYKEIGAPMPPIKVFTDDKRYIGNSDFDNQGSVVFMLFNPTCEHCEEETMLLKENISLFKNIPLIFVAAPHMGPHLEYFTNNTRLKGTPYIKVGLDSSDYINNTFNYESLPQINIYNKERKLIKVFNGITPIDSLKKYIQ